MKTTTKHIVEIKRNFLGKEVERVEYDIEVPQECNHRWVYDDKYGVGRECELCGVRQEWTGNFRPLFRDDYFINEWLQINPSTGNSGYNDLLTKLKAILKRNQDPTFGTYDYDGIAVEVIKLVTK